MTVLDRGPQRTGAGTGVSLVDLRRTYGALHALDGLSLDIAPGEMVVLLGPSGCGKTTALRILAGLDRADAGQVLVGGEDIGGVPANKRDMGMVFQAYSLFPHMTVRDNVAFGLRLRGQDRGRRLTRSREMLELVGLSQFEDRYAHQLSGGQQQRVALARALAVEPAVLLLDEPLSALDAKVRVQLREEIRRVQLDVGTTTLFVTHDQEEALAVADRVGVMNAGRLDQIAPPAELYARPSTRFVAEFVGLSNRVTARVEAGHADVMGSRVPLLDGSVEHGPGRALVRPEAVSVTAADGAEGNARVVSVAFLGPFSRVQCRLDDGQVVIAQIPSSAADRLAQDAPVRVDVSADAVLVLPD
jgi:putative spermidine/putrescine transport system ATP-binding protein